MKANVKFFRALLGLFMVPGFYLLNGQESTLPADLVQPGAQVEKVAGGFAFTEGASCDAKGNVYFTDQPNNKIIVWSLDGTISTFMEPCGRSNGTYFDSKGNLWTAADEKTEIWKIAPDKKVTVVLGQYMGKALNGPNDLWVTKKGGVYFTDPFFVRTWWDHTAMPQPGQYVYYLSPDGKTLTKVVDDLLQPNGIVGTPDEKTLYVADMRGRKTWSYTINPDGTLSDKKLVCEMGSDGMTLDEKGNIYLCGNAVTIFDKNGKQLGKITVPGGQTRNLCFGDSDRKSLFITANTGLYRIKMQVRGVE
jgi:gluconolactonase